MHALERVGGGSRDDLPRLDVAGQRDEPHVGMRHDPLADRNAVARDDVQHARRQHVGGELGEAKQRERRLLGRLQHLRVPGRERRGELPHRHHQRVVPGRDPADDAERLAPDHRGVAAHVLTRALALEHARRAREEAQVVDAHRHLVARIGKRLADVLRLDRGQLLGVLLEHPREPEQHLGALARRRVEPLRQRRARRRDRLVDVLGAAARHDADRLLGRRVQHLHRLAGGGGAPAAADEDSLGRDHRRDSIHDHRALATRCAGSRSPASAAGRGRPGGSWPRARAGRRRSSREASRRA